MLKQFIETGRIVGTHGIRGEMRLEVWADSPQFLQGIKKLYLNDNGENGLNVVSARPHKNIVILKIKGVESIEKAEEFRGKIVYLDRNDKPLEEGRYYIQDLVGCTVLHFETDEKLGELTEVSQTGANDVWHIQKGEKEYLIPVIPSVVKTVEPQNGIIKITPLKGIFDDAN